MRNKLFLTKIIKKNNISIISILLFVSFLLNSLTSSAKQNINNNNHYHFLATHRISTPIFLESNKSPLTTQRGTKFAQKPTKRSISKAKHKATEEDSTGKNKVISLFERNGVFELKLQIKETDRKIMITVYNLLAKKVLDVYHGYPHKDSESPYPIETSTLSEGVYLCIIQGENFRLLKKFIISR